MSEFAQTAVAKPLARQIKRYLKAPLHRWAAIVPPEAAGLCRAELRDLGIENATVSEAGVEFTARLEAGYLANLWLRHGSGRSPGTHAESAAAQPGPRDESWRTATHNRSLPPGRNNA